MSAIQELTLEKNKIIERLLVENKKLTAENTRLQNALAQRTKRRAEMGAVFNELPGRLRQISSSDPESMYNDLFYLARELDDMENKT